MRTSPQQTMELLAPAGSLQAFEAAVEAGADAIYIGAPALNARNLARHFSRQEIAAMVDYAHARKVRVYVAMNSLAKEKELPEVLESLSFFSSIFVDALIVQDLGIAALAGKFFPRLPLHASTLMTAHNSNSVRMLAELGFKRIVLARELTLAEIGAIAAKCPVELEVFVHGAMCFAFSGLCLFSSYLGGKSGLRGRCVQPCRRRYTVEGKGGKSGYFFSMHDLEAVSLLPRLQRAGVHSLKIEGRMRTAAYVEQVVKAYRMVLDKPEEPGVLAEAQSLLQTALGRKSSSGFFLQKQPKNLLSPYHSGNTGIFLGKIEAVKGQLVRCKVRHPVSRGDRLRCHNEKSGDRFAFTLQEIAAGKKNVLMAREGTNVWLPVSGRVMKGDSLFLVDTAANRRKETATHAIEPEKFARRVAGLGKAVSSHSLLQKFYRQLQKDTKVSGKQRGVTGRQPGRQREDKGPADLLIRAHDFSILRQRFEEPVSGYIIILNRETAVRFERGRIPVSKEQLIWGLPPIVMEEDLVFYQGVIDNLLARGHRQFQISQVGQLLFFRDREVRNKSGKAGKGIVLYGHYTLNALNSASFWAIKGLGIDRIECSLETDRDNLLALCDRIRDAVPGMTVYGMPPLFTARLMDKAIPFDRIIVSPKRERFRVRRQFGQTVVVDTMPVCLLDRREEMEKAGIRYLVLDLTSMPTGRRELQELNRLLKRGSCGSSPFSRFNYLGRLQ
jgi:putative protease